MTKVLVLYYSTYGHIAQMADAIADGARSEGAEVDVRRVPDFPGAEVARPDDSTLSIDELADYDAIVIGTGTRFGRMSAPMAAFLDQAGGLWATGKLNGKVGAAFTSSATQHGGQETTLFSIITNLLHFGMTVVGLDYGYAAQMGHDDVVGGAPYGATTIAGGRGERQPSEADLGGARYLGARAARTAAKLFG
jgi:NAD(P)H dehydrogenase (quinone)